MLSKRTFVAASLAGIVAAGLATAALAQTANPRVVITTAAGAVTLELYADKAPVTAANFLRYVDKKRFDGATFYRASKPAGQVAND